MCCRDQHTPLHLSAAWGLEKTVQCLMEHSADVNAKVTMSVGMTSITTGLGSMSN